MPNIKSAKKRVIINQTKAARNKALKSSLKTSIKKFVVLAEEGKSEALNDAYQNAIVKIDQAVTKGILHKNTAARKKSQLTLRLNRIS